MNKLTFISILLFTLTICSCDTKERSTSPNFQGMWKLDKFETFDTSSGIWILDTSRIGYSGFIIYDGIGHMSVQLLPLNYKNLNTNIDVDTLDIESLKSLTRLYSSNHVYFAVYVFSDTLVEHKIVSANNPKDIGNTLIRNFKFKNDTLILTPRVALGDKQFRLKWVKFS
jgi:hypothetical protein